MPSRLCSIPSPTPSTFLTSSASFLPLANFGLLPVPGIFQSHFSHRPFAPAVLSAQNTPPPDSCVAPPLTLFRFLIKCHLLGRPQPNRIPITFCPLKCFLFLPTLVIVCHRLLDLFHYLIYCLSPPLRMSAWRGQGLFFHLPSVPRTGPGNSMCSVIVC